ncbi:2OG-Fe(II) oxygenase [Sorangium sp. So ce1024]|uniref:2OG-Fe(II) oxygenase n=1 Tax=Sorangium sp. So ce1024 TaxID=3133327 RepID=UPI003EFFB1E0
MLDAVRAALAAIEAEGGFAIELGCGSDDLHIEVEGVGPLRYPISAATARKLCAVARPAPFGRRDKTLHDVRVRDTWEIDGGRIEIDARRWQRTLAPTLTTIQQRLGLPEGGKLEAVLDKMLVYGPGQFFAPHQDSERADDMVGTLVVELPSRHEGGIVVVEHHGEKRVFSGAARGPKDLSLLAFYADCHHEVKPVQAGYRITLTYHLLYRGAATEPARLPRDAVERLCASVDAYFSTPVQLPYSRSTPQRPDRLIYLLDHQYTAKSLGWDRLKNVDRLRVAALRAVGERLDCEVYLALADVHECWSCEGDDWGGGYGYGRRAFGGGHHDFEEDREADDHELVELLDADVELGHWVGPDGRVAANIPARLTMDEVCFTRASTEIDPFRSEREGYMGNYGNTVDRWYHRAALVMWPRARSFVIRAKVSPAWAVGQLASRVEAGRLDEARDRAKELLPFWRHVAPNEASEAFVLKLLSVSASLGDAELALGLLSPLGPHHLSPRATPAFVSLVQQYGSSWAQRLFSAWQAATRHDTPPWLSLLPHLCEALAAGGAHGKALAAWLLSREVESFKRCYTGTLRLPDALRAERIEGYVDDILALLATAAVIRAPSVRDDLVAFLTAPETALPLMTAGALLKRCREGRTPAAARALGLQPLYRRVVALLDRAVAAEARSPDDWSIEPPSGCSCALCKQLSAFLRDRARIEVAWPLAEERRRHIHGVIDLNRLPVTHVTLRRGRPYTLVLTKQEALFERDAALRAQQKALLAWLKKQRSAFSESGPSIALS